MDALRKLYSPNRGAYASVPCRFDSITQTQKALRALATAQVMEIQTVYVKASRSTVVGSGLGGGGRLLSGMGESFVRCRNPFHHLAARTPRCGRHGRRCCCRRRRHPHRPPSSPSPPPPSNQNPSCSADVCTTGVRVRSGAVSVRQ